jgi:hypothetical protein
MATGIFTVGNFEAWGNLVKRWAKGDQPRPTTIQQLKDQCDGAGVGATISGYETLDIVQSQSETHLLLRLPPKKQLEASETRLATGSYSIPPFYKRIFDHPADPAIPTAQNMTVHAERIGDYTMAACQ